MKPSSSIGTVGWSSPPTSCRELDFSVIETVEQLDSVIRRDFETKAPTGTEILDRVRPGPTTTRYALMRDVALNLFWVNRFAMTMYDKRPTRWRDVPRTRGDVFLPVLEPWEDGERKVAAVEQAYATLPADLGRGDRGPDLRGPVRRLPAPQAPRHRRCRRSSPTVAEVLEDPRSLTFQLPQLRPGLPGLRLRPTSSTASEDVPELEALHRWAMVLHNQYPWDRAEVRADRGRRARDDDFVVAVPPAQPRRCARFLRPRQPGAPRRRPAPGWLHAPEVVASSRSGPTRPSTCAQQFTVLPRIEALAVVHGEIALHQRRPHPQRRLLLVADDGRRDQRQDRHRAAPLHRARASTRSRWRRPRRRWSTPGRGPEEIGAVLFCSCTSTRLMPSMATWLSGQLGMLQTHVVGRHRRRLRRAALRALRGHPAAAGGRAAGAAGLRGEVLRQDRHRPAVPDDLRRRRRRVRRRRRPPRASAPTSTCCRPTPAAR